MASKYAFGMGVNGQARSRARDNYGAPYSPAAAEYNPPTFRDLSLYLEDIPRGKEAKLIVEPRAGYMYGNFYPQAFVFAGTRDLWLLPSSSCDHAMITDEALPLDTFRAGAPHRISWPRIRPGSDGGRMQLDIENRGRARNEQRGTFIGRLSCIVSPDDPPGYQPY